VNFASSFGLKRISNPWLKIATNAHQALKRLHDNFQGARRKAEQFIKT